MRRRLPALVVMLCAVAGTAAGAAPLDGPDFQAETEGWTIRFRLLGAPYGAEQYFADRRVLWRDAAGTCLHGRWEPRGGEICFIYEDAPDDARCWIVERDAAGLSARLPGDPPELALREASRSRAPLECPAPDLGV